MDPYPFILICTHLYKFISHQGPRGPMGPMRPMCARGRAHGPGFGQAVGRSVGLDAGSHAI